MSTADTCSACRKDREKEGRSGRVLRRLPLIVTQGKLFRRKGLPVRLCDYCDGDAFEAAMATNQRRIEG